MKGLSQDIESAIKIILEGLEYEFEVESLNPEKMKTSMDAKINSFKYAKDMLNKWNNSPNAPSQEKLEQYIKRLVEAGDVSLSILRKALIAPIDYDNLEPSKIDASVKAKPYILEAVHSLEASLVELKMQIEAESYNLDDKEFETGLAEKFAKQEFFPENHYHKKWYNEKEDSIMICPKGTIGETIDIDGLRITLPKPPRKKSEILFSDLPKKEQYWKRTPLPKGLTPETRDAFIDYIMEEFRRRREGIWIMVNGKKVYLTGSAYFTLQWGKMMDNGDYMDFRFSQLEIFYFKEACLRDPRSLGELFVKSRRTGFTYITLGMMLDSATSTCNATYGMTSQSNEDALKAWHKFSYMFLNLPFFFRPVVKGVEDSPVKLEFAKPSDKSKKAKKARNTSTDDYLNTKIDFQPTKDGSYDGQKMKQYLGDEASKWKKPANYLNHWGRFSPTMDEGGTIVGKAWIGSTVNPMNQGGEEFKTLAFGALIEKRNSKTGRTPNGLYCHFLPAHKNMREFTDIYGYCWTEKPPKDTYNVDGKLITMGSVEYLESVRATKKKESDILYNEELRAMPMTMSEAFRDDAKNTLFNIEKLVEQMEYNESIILDHHITKGNFRWKNGIRFGEVEFYPTEKGRFFVSWIPNENIRNKWKVKNGVRYPAFDYGAFGCDSYDISGTVDGSGSKGSMIGVTGYSIDPNIPSNTFFLEYIARPSTAEMFYEDVLMACIFYSIPILVENNKPRILYHFKNNGYRGYSLNRPDKHLSQLSKTERELGGVPSASDDMKITHASAIEDYIDKYVGVYTEEDEEKQIREYGSMGNMMFQRTLKDWHDFDISKREKFDASIASGYALMAIKRHLYVTRKEVKKINLGLTTFNNKGVISSVKNG